MDEQTTQATWPWVSTFTMVSYFPSGATALSLSDTTVELAVGLLLLGFISGQLLRIGVYGGIAPSHKRVWCSKCWG